MSMEVNRQELKARARERLRASHPAFWKITLVYLLLTSGVTAVADLAGAARIGLPPLHLDTFALFLSLLVILYTTVMHLGYQWWALRTYRQQPTGYGALIDGFSMAGRVILMNVVIFFSALGWAVAFALPYSLVLFLLSGLVSSASGCCSSLCWPWAAPSSALCGSATAMPWPPICSSTTRSWEHPPRSGRA